MCPFLERKVLASLTIKTPQQEIIPVMDLVVHEEFTGMFGEDALAANGQRIQVSCISYRLCTCFIYESQVRTYNLDKVKRMRDLDPSDIDQLVALHGKLIFLVILNVQ